MLRPTPLEAIVVGASAGAVDALRVLLPSLPAGLSIPVVLVVHIPARQPNLLPQLCAPWCALDVREPVDKAPVASGVVWLAPPDYHLLIERDRRFALSTAEPVNFSRPAIDVLFESAADVYGPSLLSVILTGASRDGAAGAARVRQGGGLVAVQAPHTAEAPYMPAAAIARSDPQFIGDLPALARFITEVLPS